MNKGIWEHPPHNLCQMLFSILMGSLSASMAGRNIGDSAFHKLFGSSIQTVMYIQRQDPRIKKDTFMEMHIQNKAVPIYSSPAAGEQCHVHILDTYLLKLPKDAVEKDIFHLRPLSNPTAPWFQNVPIGKNQLGKMVPNMCSSAGITGNKTNHSLHATVVTDLFYADTGLLYPNPAKMATILHLLECSFFFL